MRELTYLEQRVARLERYLIIVLAVAVLMCGAAGVAVSVLAPSAGDDMTLLGRRLAATQHDVDTLSGRIADMKVAMPVSLTRSQMDGLVLEVARLRAAIFGLKPRLWLLQRQSERPLAPDYR